MSEIMTPAAVVADVRTPIDGEPASAATLRSETLQTLLDRTKWLIDLLSGTLAAATGIVVKGLQVNGSANVGDVETPRAFNVWGSASIIGSLLSTGASFLRGDTAIGAVDGSSTITFAGRQKDDATDITVMSGDATLDYTGAHTHIFNPNGQNRTVNLGSGAGHPDHITKHIVHGGTANTLTLVCTASQATIVVLQPGQERNPIRKNGRWY